MTRGTRRDAGRPVSTTAPLVANIVALLFCFPIALIGVFIALGTGGKKGAADPAGTERRVRRAWICFWSALLLGVTFFVVSQPRGFSHAVERLLGN